MKDALPEAAVKGFVGAVKKQLNQLTERETDPVETSGSTTTGMKNLEELTDQIEEKLADRETARKC